MLGIFRNFSFEKFSLRSSMFSRKNSHAQQTNREWAWDWMWHKIAISLKLCIICVDKYIYYRFENLYVLL